MPKRDSTLLIEDMLSAIRKIERYMTGLEREGFLGHDHRFGHGSGQDPGIFG